MNLTKGKISKIINTKSQSNKNRKLGKIGKNGKKNEHYRTYKTNMHFNLINKTIKRMKGGVAYENAINNNTEDIFDKFSVTLDDVSFNGKSIPKIYDFDYIPPKLAEKDLTSSLNLKSTPQKSTFLKSVKGKASSLKKYVNNVMNDDNDNNLSSINNNYTPTSERAIKSKGLFGSTHIKAINPLINMESNNNNNISTKSIEDVLQIKSELMKELVGEKSSKEIIQIVEDWIDDRIKKSCKNNMNIDGGLQNSKEAVGELLNTTANI